MGIEATPAGHATLRRPPHLKLLVWLRQASPSWPVLVGALVFSIYIGLTPFIARTWRATGDEPHYLLAAHSLAVDKDFDLANNYEQLDYLNFYFSKDINRQIRTNLAGQQILNHHLGLPLLITPAYALGGRFGVLLFQGVLGGVLAALTFKLTTHICGNEKAALLATLFVAFTPPLFMYNYLVYPEIAGALLTTLILYVALAKNRPAPAALALVLLGLALLPWFNRRFVPLAVLLAGFTLWAWRSRESIAAQPGFGRLLRSFTWPGWLGLAVTLISIGLLVWFNSQLNAPPRADFIAPEDSSVLWNRLGRSVGWLVDQQRGLFIFGPIYIFALWGVPLLLQRSWQAKDRRWFVVAPFALSLAAPALAGGFWVPWELGPRFLVVALPALAPLLALAWQHYPRLRLLAVGLLFFSLLNSWAITRNPEMPYKSSLPIYYGQKLGLPLTELLPDMAGFAKLAVGQANPEANQVVTDRGRPAWFAPAGESGLVVQSGPLHQLPWGHYRLIWPLRVAPNLPPETKLLRLSAQYLGGGQLFNHIVTAANLPGDGSYGILEYRFTNTNPDRWRTPLILHAVSSGQSDIWGRDAHFEPQPFYAWLLPYLYLGLMLGGALASWLWLSEPRAAAANAGRLARLPGGVRWGVLALFLLLAGGYAAYQAAQPGRTYQMADLFHFVGRAEPDSAAVDGRAWRVDPQFDPPQKATHGPFDIYDAGQYKVNFRVKLLEPVTPEVEVARLQVNATANLEPLRTQPVQAKHFSRVDLYHDLVLPITNPRRQALSFEIHYLGVAPLAIDSITITKMGD